MSKWFGDGFSQLKGQLTEFTKEVLSETTEEVEDPDTELQVRFWQLSIYIYFCESLALEFEKRF